MQLTQTPYLQDVHIKLSVSSVGSEAMQQLEEVEREIAEMTAFSILGRIGGDATLASVAESVAADYPFSILGRIGGDATFQVVNSVARVLIQLSVSSVGSEAMQQSSTSSSLSEEV